MPVILNIADYRVDMLLHYKPCYSQVPRLNGTKNIFMPFLSNMEAEENLV